MRTFYHSFILVGILFFSYFVFVKNPNLIKTPEGIQNNTEEKVNKIKPTISPIKLVKPTETHTNNSEDLWGVARQIDEHTWTLRIGEDSRMTTKEELLDALNNYRGLQGSRSLTWDNNLTAFAQGRADYFNKIKKLDGHKGFEAYLSNEDNVRALGYSSYGENSSSGYKLIGVHLIEWVYAADKDHNDNQLDPSWTHVGIGINGTETDLIFAKDRI